MGVGGRPCYKARSYSSESPVGGMEFSPAARGNRHYPTAANELTIARKTKWRMTALAVTRHWGWSSPATHSAAPARYFPEAPSSMQPRARQSERVPQRVLDRTAETPSPAAFRSSAHLVLAEDLVAGVTALGRTSIALSVAPRRRRGPSCSPPQRPRASHCRTRPIASPARGSWPRSVSAIEPWAITANVAESPPLSAVLP